MCFDLPAVFWGKPSEYQCGHVDMSSETGGHLSKVPRSLGGELINVFGLCFVICLCACSESTLNVILVQ